MTETATKVRDILSSDTVNKLEALAKARGISLIEALEQAVETEHFLWSQIQEEKAKVFIQKGGYITELLFK